MSDAKLFTGSLVELYKAFVGYSDLPRYLCCGFPPPRFLALAERESHSESSMQSPFFSTSMFSVLYRISCPILTPSAK